MVKVTVNLCVLVCVICASECQPWFPREMLMPLPGPLTDSFIPPQFPGRLQTSFQSSFSLELPSHSTFEPLGFFGHRPLFQPRIIPHSLRTTTPIRTQGIDPMSSELSVMLIRLQNNVAPTRPNAAEQGTGSPAAIALSSFGGNENSSIFPPFDSQTNQHEFITQLNKANTVQHLPQRNITITIPFEPQQPMVPTSIFIQSDRSRPVASPVPHRIAFSHSNLPSVKNAFTKQTGGTSFPQETFRGHDIPQQTLLLVDQTPMPMQQVRKQTPLPVQQDRMPVQQTPALALNISLQGLLRVQEAIVFGQQNNRLPLQGARLPLQKLPRRQAPSSTQDAPVPLIYPMSSGTEIGIIGFNDAFIQFLSPTSSPLQEAPVPAISSRSSSKKSGQSGSANAAEQFFSPTSAPLQEVPGPVISSRHSTRRRGQSGSANANEQFFSPTSAPMQEALEPVISLRPSTRSRGQSGSANAAEQLLSPTSATMQEVQRPVIFPWSSTRERGQSGSAGATIQFLSPTSAPLHDAQGSVISPRSSTREREQSGSAGAALQFLSPTSAPLHDVQEPIISPWSSTRKRGQSRSVDTGAQFLQEVQEPVVSSWPSTRMFLSPRSSLQEEIPEPMTSSGPNRKETGQSGSVDTAVSFLSANTASGQEVQGPIAGDMGHSGSPDINTQFFSPTDKATGGGTDIEQEEPSGGEEKPLRNAHSSNSNTRQRT